MTLNEFLKNLAPLKIVVSNILEYNRSQKQLAGVLYGYDPDLIISAFISIQSHCEHV